MDTLSSSVQSLTVILPGHHSTPHQLLYHFKTSNKSHLSSSHSPFSFTKSTSNHLAPFSTGSRNFSCSTVPFEVSADKQSSFRQSPSSSTLRLHVKAASGYAAALVDVARCSHSLEAVVRDVRRLSKWRCNELLRAFMSDPMMEESAKGQVVKEIAKKGRFHRHLAVLVKLLVERNKVGLMNDVLNEFERIYDVLTGSNPVVSV